MNTWNFQAQLRFQVRVVLQYYIDLILKVFLALFRQYLLTQNCFRGFHVKQIVQL